MDSCYNCAGTGTTIIAVIALILVIILIILVAVFFFFPSSQTILDIRGINFNVKNGIATGSTGATGTSGTNADSLDTGANNLYISQPLVGDITLTLNSSSLNFVGLTVGVKNTTDSSSTDSTITLLGNGVKIDPGGLDNTVEPG